MNPNPTYYWRNGWEFERFPDGTVTVTKRYKTGSAIAAVIPFDEWISIVAAMAPCGEAIAYPLARNLYQWGSA